MTVDEALENYLCYMKLVILKLAAGTAKKVDYKNDRADRIELIAMFFTASGDVCDREANAPENVKELALRSRKKCIELLELVGYETMALALADAMSGRWHAGT